MAPKKEDYLADTNPTIVCLAIKQHFDSLNDQEKRYAHYISRAAFLGTRITLRQISYESEDIFDFILALYEYCSGDWHKVTKDSKIQENDLKAFLAYSAQFLGNCGNYKSFGDSKFVPNLDPKFFDDVSKLSPSLGKLRAKIGDGLFYTEKSPGLMHLGFPSDGHLSTYYPESPFITKDEIQAVGKVLETKGLRVENTRLRRIDPNNFECLIASALANPPDVGDDFKNHQLWSVNGKFVRLIYGDYAKELREISESLKKAKENAANNFERKMHEEYIKHFETGSMEAFADSQRWWIRDKGPMVESNIGFIETYRDPQGVRGEWEGFVAMVNKERTKAFGRLVAKAESLVPTLPWPKDFEKDEFLSPDFTSLEVLSFQGSGIPAGINIPNLDDIRQTEGFKNVSLGNVLSAKSPNEKAPFIRDEDQELYAKHRDLAFEVQVGIHELLGHGTGKLLQETSPGKYNFDIKDPPVDPITKNKIKTWYGPGQTWGSVFGSIASSYEECRAECVAMFLGCNFDILKIFGVGDGHESMEGEAGDVLYVSYLSMARAGLAAMEFYDPNSKKWGQIHMQARFAILKCFLEAGDNFVTFSHSPKSGHDIKGLTVSVNRSKILTTGRSAVGAFLQKLHIFKSTADFASGKKLYQSMTEVGDWWDSDVRNEVLRQKIPRKVFVQANTVIDDNGKVSLVEYDATPEGMIRSWAERHV